MHTARTEFFISIRKKLDTIKSNTELVDIIVEVKDYYKKHYKFGIEDRIEMISKQKLTPSEYYALEEIRNMLAETSTGIRAYYGVDLAIGTREIRKPITPKYNRNLFVELTSMFEYNSIRDTLLALEILDNIFHSTVIKF